MANNYVSLQQVFNQCLHQASDGKGSERHGSDAPFEQQSSMLRGHVEGGPFFQAMKKCIESGRLDKHAALRELYGAVNYLSMAIILIKEQEDDHESK